MNVHSNAYALAASVSLGKAGGKLTAAGARIKAAAQKRAVITPSAVMAALVLSMHPASAQTAGGTGSFVTFMTNVVNLITGTAGQALAIIAVALCGIGAMFGALSTRQLGAVLVGVALIFSAAWIVGQITGAGA